MATLGKRAGASVLLLSAGLLASRPAAAQDSEPPQRVAALRFSVFPVAWPGLAHASLSLYAIPHVEVEAGLYGSLGFSSQYLRAGPSWTLHDGRGLDGRGLSVHAPALVGYQHFKLTGGSAHALSLTGALAADAWLSRHFGFELQLQLGADLILAGATEQEPSVFPEARLAVGLCF